MGLLGSNPLTHVRVPALPHVERTVWGTEEVRLFRETTAADRERALWDVLLGAGLRIGEALGLQWSDIGTDTLRVARTLSYLGAEGYRLGPPKTRAGIRTLVLPPWVMESLRRWRIHQAEERLRSGQWADDRGAVFTDACGRPLSPGSLRRRFRKACGNAGVPPIRIHDLRHVHASLAVAMGADPKTVQARLGHSTLDMTLGVYSHRAQDADRQLAERLPG